MQASLSPSTTQTATGSMSLPGGVWPVMLTPFSKSGHVDHEGLEALVDWYVREGSTGLFALCLSSEVYQLSQDEQLAVLRTVMRSVRGRVPVVAGALGGERADALRPRIHRLMECGVEAVVLNLAELVGASDDDAHLASAIRRLCAAFPGTPLGFYECPLPYHRLLGNEAVLSLVECDAVRFVKDTSCHIGVVRERRRLWSGSPLRHFEAHTPNLLESLREGAHGFSGIGSNFFPGLYAWVCAHYASHPQQVGEVVAFLAGSDRRMLHKYPVSAKAHLRARASLPIEPISRAKPNVLTAEELWALDAMADEADRLAGLCAATNAGLAVTP